MQANRRNLLSASMLFCGLILTQSFATPLHAATVSYTGGGTGTLTSPFDSGGVTVTSSGTLYHDNTFGLGVVGGLQSFTIDNSESANFAFDSGAATGVIFNSAFEECNNGCTNEDISLLGFGVGGNSLGSVAVNVFGGFTFNVSSLFGGVPLSSFTIDGGTNAGLSVSSITYTPAAATPEPSSLMLLGSGVIAMAGVVRRRLSA